MTTIHKEHYRDFVGTLSSKRLTLDNEMSSIRWSDGDDATYYEYNNLYKEFDHLTSIQKFFMDSSKWSYFDSLETLKLYVQVIENAYKNIDAYSKTVLPVDGGNLVGITNKEWDELESYRYKLQKKLAAWSLFTYFCENGNI